MQVEKKNNNNPEFVMKTFPLTEVQAKRAALVSPIQHSEARGEDSIQFLF